MTTLWQAGNTSKLHKLADLMTKKIRVRPVFKTPDKEPPLKLSQILTSFNSIKSRGKANNKAEKCVKFR